MHFVTGGGFTTNLAEVYWEPIQPIRSSCAFREVVQPGVSCKISWVERLLAITQTDDEDAKDRSKPYAGSLRGGLDVTTCRD
jgi:hypothetical protein